MKTTAAAPEGRVALLFTDLVGSTGVLERLGDAAAENVRGAHVGLLREAAAAHSGHEMKNLGGGLMIVFGSAVEAVGCAVALNARLASQLRPRQQESRR